MRINEAGICHQQGDFIGTAKVTPSRTTRAAVSHRRDSRGPKENITAILLLEQFTDMKSGGKESFGYS